jgi:hypothetical protein
MDRGHVKLWRKSMDSGLLQNSNVWTFWCWCLLKATWKEREMLVNFQVVKLFPGQFIFGRVSASHELKMSERSIRTCLDKLKNMGNLTIKTTNRYSVISIVNWGIYQGNRPSYDQQTDQPTTSRRPADDHKQEVKEVKERKEQTLSHDLKKSSDTKKDPDILKFVSRFQENAKIECGNLGIEVTESLLSSCYDTIEKLIRIDKFDKFYVFDVIRWAYKDAFWSAQVRSLAPLRTKSKNNGLTKFQNIANAMTKPLPQKHIQNLPSAQELPDLC